MRYELNGPATLLVSGALTTLGTGVANDPVELARVVKGVARGEEVSVYADPLPPMGTLAVSTQVKEPGGTEEREITLSVPADREWARNFADDPAATAPLSPSDVSEIRLTVEDLIGGTTRITGMEVQGVASDEANTVMPDGSMGPGLGVRNRQNDELANARGRAVGAEAEGIVEDTVGYPVPVRYLPGKEEVNADLADRLEVLAEGLGASTLSLVAQYNRDPQSVPQEVRTVLRELDENRRVDITLQVHEKLQIPPVTRTEVDEAHFMPLPFPVVVPVLPRSGVARAATLVPAGRRPQVPAQRPPERLAATGRHVPAVPSRIKQPRNHNFGKNPPRSGGRMERSKGGSRRGKRPGKR